MSVSPAPHPTPGISKISGPSIRGLKEGVQSHRDSPCSETSAAASLGPTANRDIVERGPARGRAHLGRRQRLLKARPLNREEEVPLRARELRLLPRPEASAPPGSGPGGSLRRGRPAEREGAFRRQPRPSCVSPTAMPHYVSLFLPPFPPPNPPPIRPATPKEEMPDGTVASCWWNEVAHGLAWVRPGRNLAAVPRCLHIPQPHLCSKTRDNQRHPPWAGPGAAPSSNGTESHDVAKQSQRNPSPSSLVF